MDSVDFHGRVQSCSKIVLTLQLNKNWANIFGEKTNMNHLRGIKVNIHYNIHE